MRKLHFVGLIMVVALGFGLRLAYLDRSMRFDEALTFVAYASKNIPTIIADYSQPNNHIFNTLFMHFSYRLAGNHPMIIRLSAWAAGILVIPLTYEFARRLFNRDIALLAAGLTAVSPALVDLSVNARGYSLQTFLTVLLLLLGWRAKQFNHTRDWLLFAVVSACGFLTIPTMLYPMGVVALWLLSTIWLDFTGFKQRALLKNYIVAIFLGAVLTGVLYTPVIMFTGVNAFFANEYVIPLPPAEYYSRFGEVWTGFAEYLAWGGPMIMAVIVGLGALTGVIVHQRVSNTKLSPLLMVFCWLIPVLVIQRVFPYPRTMTPLIPLYLTVAAAGLIYVLHSLLRSRNLITAASLGFVSLLAILLLQSNVLFTSNDTGWAEDAEMAAFYLADTMHANDAVFYSYPTNWAVEYYKGLHGLTDTVNPAQGEQERYIYYHWPEERARLLDALVSDVDPAYENATFNVVRQFPYSTLEAVTLPDEHVMD